jgi:hypothetical protein
MGVLKEEGGRRKEEGKENGASSFVLHSSSFLLGS